MANIPISSLPIAVALTGSEAVPMVQAGVTKTATVSLINSVNPANVPVGGTTGQALIKSSNLNYATMWSTLIGAGTVQQVNTGTGLTGGPITLAGTISLANIATGNVLANTSGISAAPIPTAPSSVLDVIGSTQGSVLYRSGTGWSALTPGTTGQILTTQGASANPIWSNVGSGSVTSVALTLPSIFTVGGSPVTSTGTLTGSFNNQNANIVFAGPSTGAATTPAFRALVGADLPNPSASTLGGVQSAASVSHQWINSISTSGVPALSQPAFTDISGTVAAAQLPNPSATTLGGIESLAAVTSKWINQISTSGVPSATQPNFSDLSGTATLAQLPSIGNNTILANISGASSTPLADSLSAIIDSGIGNTQGDILYRNASSWVVLAPGTNGQVLSTGGAAANPSWATVTGTGTVTSIATNNGVTGGTITSSGTIGLATIATGNVLAYTGAGSGVPVATAPTAVLDVIGSTEGDVLYRGASTWAALAPGTAGQFLQTGGAGSTPAWASAITSITAGTGLTGGTITTTGTIALSTPVSAANGGTGVSSPAAHTIPINAGSSAQNNTGAGTIGQALVSGGASADPSWKSGTHVLLNTLTASTSATLSDTSSFTSTYNDYEIVFENMVPDTGSVSFQLQVHSGGSFQATSYITQAQVVTGGAASFAQATTFIQIGANQIIAGPGISGTAKVYGPVSGASVAKQWTALMSGVQSGPAGVSIMTAGYWNNTAAVDGFQVKFSSGNITSGTVKIYGIL